MKGTITVYLLYNWQCFLAECTTTSGPDTNKTCSFPFRDIYGRNHSKCTMEGDTHYWCATEKGDSWQFDGKWGYCSAACPHNTGKYNIKLEISSKTYF